MAASSDDENSNWDDECSSSSSSEEPVKPAAAKAPAGGLVNKKPAGTQPPGDFRIPERLAHERDDPNEERLRLEEINLLRDKHLSGNMFGDSSDEDEDVEINPAVEVAQLGGKDGRLTSSGGAAPIGGLDAIRSLSLTRLQEIDELCAVLCPKISNSVGKSVVWLRLLDKLLQSCAGKMDPQDLYTLQRKVQSAATERKRAVNFQFTSAKKGTDLKVDIRNPRAELDIAAGIGASDYSESESDVEDEGGLGM